MNDEAVISPDSAIGSVLASRVDITIVALYLVLMVAVGFWVSRFNKSDSDFFRGGKQMPWWLAGASLFVSSFSVYTFTGASSMGYRAPGVAFSAYLVNGFGYLLGFLFLASRWRRTRSSTIYSYLSERYNVATNQVYSWTMMVAVFFQSGIMLLALAKFASVAMGYSLNEMIIVCGLVIALYCLIGGLWAVVITDTLQFMVIFPCATVIAVLALNSVGGPVEFVDKLIDSWSLTASGEYLSGEPWSFQPSFVWAHLVMMIFATSSGSAAQRYFSVKAEPEARKVALFVFVLITLAPLLWLAPPFAARYLDVGADLQQISQALNMPAAEESAYVVFCLKFLPIGAIGVVLSAMLAATMSTLSSNFNAYAAVITDDIIKRLFMKNATERRLLLVGRIVTLLQGVIVIVLAILMSQRPGGVFQLMLDFSGIVVIPAGIPIFMGLIYRRTPQWAAIASYLTGLILGVVTMFVLPENYDLRVFGWPILSNPVRFEQQIFVFGSASALVYFLPGLFIRIREGDYKRRLDAFFGKLATPIDSSEVEVSETTEAGSYQITGWSTVGMGVPIALLSLLPDLEPSGRIINLVIGLSICALGAGVLAMSRRLVRMRAEEGEDGPPNVSEP